MRLPATATAAVFASSPQSLLVAVVLESAARLATQRRVAEAVVAAQAGARVLVVSTPRELSDLSGEPSGSALVVLSGALETCASEGALVAGYREAERVSGDRGPRVVPTPAWAPSTNLDPRVRFLVTVDEAGVVRYRPYGRRRALARAERGAET